MIICRETNLSWRTKMTNPEETRHMYEAARTLYMARLKDNPEAAGELEKRLQAAIKAGTLDEEAARIMFSEVAEKFDILKKLNLTPLFYYDMLPCTE